MKTAKISIECGATIPEDGIMKVWWWKEGAELNQEWEMERPVWEIFNAKETFMLCLGETIEVKEGKVRSNMLRTQ